MAGLFDDVASDLFADVPDDDAVPEWLAKSRRMQERAHGQHEGEEALRPTTFTEDATAFLTGAADYASGGAVPAIVAGIQRTGDIRPEWLKRVAEPFGGNFKTGSDRPFADLKDEAEATRDDINTRAPGAFAAGQAVGAVGPGGVVGRGVGSGAAATRHVVPGSLVARGARGAVEGAKAGAPLGAIAGAGQTETGEIDDVLANAAVGGVGGAVVGGGLGAAGAPAAMQTRLGSGGLRALAKNLGIDGSDVSRAANAFADVPFVGAPVRAVRAAAKAAGIVGDAPKPRAKVKESNVSAYEAKPEPPAPWGAVTWTPPTSSSSATAPATNAARSPLRELVKFTPAVDDVAATTSAPQAKPKPKALDAADDTAAPADDLRTAAVAQMNADDATGARLASLPETMRSGAPVPKNPTPAKAGPTSSQVQTGPAGQMRVPVDPHAMPGDRNYGVTMTIDEIAELQAAGKMRTTAPPSASLEEQARAMPLATPRPLPVTDATLKAAVEEGVRNGTPLPALARELSKRFGVKINQGDINSYFVSAQNSLPIGPQGFGQR